MQKIITHNGRAHQDDFLAAAVCSYKLNAPAFRRPHTQEELEDKNCWVLDQGRSFDPNLHNFDHHHIEEEICAFTMVLDHFYGKEYRKHSPELRFVEIFDSYGPRKAAEFAQIKEDNLEIIASPVQSSLMKVFSKIDGEITDPMFSIMKSIGQEICTQIENREELLQILKDSVLFEYNGIRILDTTKCDVKEYKHDQLPTKIYCKINNLEPEIILTVDPRQNGYRMVSINSDNLKFLPNDKSYFTHNSGFLTGFKNYSDYAYILINFTSK